jgi:exocyst complex component 4
MNTGVSGLYIDISSLFSLVQENLIRDDNKIILLASLSDSLEYVADSIER